MSLPTYYRQMIAVVFCSAILQACPNESDLVVDAGETNNSDAGDLMDSGSVDTGSNCFESSDEWDPLLCSLFTIESRCFGSGTYFPSPEGCDHPDVSCEDSTYVVSSAAGFAALFPGYAVPTLIDWNTSQLFVADLDSGGGGRLWNVAPRCTETDDGVDLNVYTWRPHYEEGNETDIGWHIFIGIVVKTTKAISFEEINRTICVDDNDALGKVGC